MNIVTFLNNRFETLTREQAETGFTTRKFCESEALQSTLKGYFGALRFLLIPKVLLDYVLVLLRIKKAPTPALQEAKQEYEQAKRDATLNLPHVKQLKGSFPPSPKEKK